METSAKFSFSMNGTIYSNTGQKLLQPSHNPLSLTEAWAPVPILLLCSGRSLVGISAEYLDGEIFLSLNKIHMEKC